MASVSTTKMGWRRIGGGGLVLGAVLWAASLLLGLGSEGSLQFALTGLTFVVLGLAVLAVGLGPAGAGGAVGRSTFGRVSAGGFGVGWVLAGLFLLLADFGILADAGQVVTVIVGVLIAVGGILTAIAIYRAGVATAISRWILFAPAIWGVLWVLSSQGLVSIGGAWLYWIFAILWAAAGLVYLAKR